MRKIIFFLKENEKNYYQLTQYKNKTASLKQKPKKI